MDLVKTLRILILADVTFAVVDTPLDYYLEQFLPAVLIDYIRSLADGPTLDAWLLTLVLVPVLCIIVSWFGLWRLWRPARTLYLLTWIAWMLLWMILADPVIFTPIGYAIESLSILVEGMIIAVIYFTNLSDRFSSDWDRHEPSSPSAV